MSRGGRGARGRSFPRTDRLKNDAGEFQPPPLYPTLDFNSTPLLASTEEWNYSDLVKVKQAFRGAMMDSPYFLKPVEHSVIERYTDKYQQVQNASAVEKWEPDWSRLPQELRIMKKRKSGGPSVPSKKSKLSTAIDVNRKLDELQKKEDIDGVDEESPTKKKTDGEDADSEEEEEEEGAGAVEEEEYESENDYNLNYYLSGESGGDDSNDDGAYS